MAYTKETAPKCPGANGNPHLCPLKCVHPPNGGAADSEFCIGCGLCEEKQHLHTKQREKDAKVDALIAAGDIKAAEVIAAVQIQPKAVDLKPLTRAQQLAARRKQKKKEEEEEEEEDDDEEEEEEDD